MEAIFSRFHFATQHHNRLVELERGQILNFLTFFSVVVSKANQFSKQQFSKPIRMNWSRIGEITVKLFGAYLFHRATFRGFLSIWWMEIPQEMKMEEKKKSLEKVKWEISYYRIMRLSEVSESRVKFSIKLFLLFSQLNGTGGELSRAAA